MISSRLAARVRHPHSRRAPSRAPFLRTLGLAFAWLAAATVLVGAADDAWAARERAPAHRPLPALLDAAADDGTGARVIVKFRALAPSMRVQGLAPAATRGPQRASTMSMRTGLALRDGRIVDARMQVLQGPPGIDAEALARRLGADPEIEYAVPDRRRHRLALPNDPLFPANAANSPNVGQWYLRAPDATLVAAINAQAAWDLTTGSPSIVVADLDTGVVLSHPDLAGKLHPGYDFISDASAAGDGGGRDASPFDTGDWTTDGECGFGFPGESSSWHGTQTSALIGARMNNGIGMASVAGGAMVLPVRVLGKCGGTDSDIIAAMLWAGGLSSLPVPNRTPARVLNLSLGGAGPCHAAYVDAVARLNAAGVVVVVAAGNEEGLAVDSPANCPGAIAVAGVRHAGTKVGFSSLGPQVAIAAPAGNCVNTVGACLYPIVTATNLGRNSPTLDAYSDGADNISVGTSFASPLVAGTAALMLSVNPALQPAQVKALLQTSARPFPTEVGDPTVPLCRAPDELPQDECLCTTSTCGAGLLDAAAAVAAAVASGAQAPLASISASATAVVSGAQVSFSAAGSIAPSGRSIVGYEWKVVARPELAVFVGPTNGPTATLITAGDGVAGVQLTVTDSAGQSAIASTSLTIAPPTAPSATIAASATSIGAGGSVSFDGSGSRAASGLAIVSYQWAITSGNTLASFNSGTAGSSATVQTLPGGGGTFTVQLTVVDSLGRSSSAVRIVIVNGIGPTAGIGASSLAVVAGETVRFDITGTIAPAGRTIVGYEWSLLSGDAIATLSGPTNGPSVSARTLAAGSFTVQLTVVDSGGARGSRSVTVSVRPTDADRVFDWAEAAFPQYFPQPRSAGTAPPYVFRYYPGTGIYLGVGGGRVVVHNGREWNLLDVGSLADFLSIAASVGF